MSVLVVGSVALDSVETPFGRADDVLGGSATFFSASASHLTKVSVVGVVGSDYPIDKLEPLFRSLDQTSRARLHQMAIQEGESQEDIDAKLALLLAS